jgi:serine-type D-Ala-D-Ala carboxypeptidase (penicillin-binding protein 5/6)
LAALGLILLLVALIWRVASVSAPAVGVRRTLAGEVRFPGNAPALAWPHAGQAAVHVEGLGATPSSGALTPVPIASVAKVMTAYLLLREHPLSGQEEGFTITVTHAEVTEEELRAGLLQSVVPVRVGERLSERQALEALLLPSANNIAALLAAHEAGTVAAFVARMNTTARALGMRSTHYTDPSGFADATVSTAVDQLKLARMAIREPAFAAIVAEPSAELPVADDVANLDTLLGSGGYVGIKTGSDRAAGGCFVFAKHVWVGGRRLTIVGVVLGQREGALVEAALLSAQRLGDSVAAALHVETVLPAGTHVLSVSDSDGHHTSAATAGALQEIGWGGLTFAVNVAVRPTLTRPRAGARMATVTVEGVDDVSTTAVAVRGLGGPSLGWRLLHVL